MKHPAIGVVELNSIARGTVVVDAMVKKAPVEIVRSHPVCPGKFIIIVAGGVDEVNEAMEAGRYWAGYTQVDAVIVEHVHPLVLPAIVASSEIPEIRSVGIVETYSSPAVVTAADAACKAADILLIEIRLAMGIGGKAYFTFTGLLHEVHAAMEAAIARIQSGLLIRTEIIPSPHEQVGPTLF
ncbi:MAG: hypothetical protein A2284_18740 [Deltaproteobacteria bacterium RIFOXYA12_FULL_61_11]|nr:MAG: hypothetical protein A2284_18740 [Deltaproteobacteria bacterium RIFOXYA12_FULL_61_11]